MSEALDVAERFFRAIEGGDVEAIRAIYAPDARIWHNNDQREQTVDENLRVLGWVTRNLKNRRYRVTRRVAIPGGFLQQHVLEAETANGPFAMPACIVVEVANGRISRLDEYLDSAHAEALTRLVRGESSKG
jgi:ketosteroid isomerase-like protein